MTFKVGSTRDLITASGTPWFNAAALDELARTPEIDWEWIPETVAEITPDIAARYDAIHLNLPRVTADSVARDDCRVKVFARHGVGYDTVDLAACAASGSTATTTPLANRRPVAVAALTLLLSLSGKLGTKDRLVRTGRWTERVEHMGLGLTTRRLGLIGGGGIAQELIPLAAPLFREVLVADPYTDAAIYPPLGARKAAFETVLETSDFVCVLCLLTDETRHLMNADAFARMKPGAIYVNIARGPVHDEAALIQALRSGHLAAAGLDVMEREPIPADSPLIEMENTLLTPHALCWTDECFEDIARTALGSIVDVSLGRVPRHVVTP